MSRINVHLYFWIVIIIQIELYQNSKKFYDILLNIFDITMMVCDLYLMKLNSFNF